MVIAGKNMEKYGKSQASDNELAALYKIPQLPWKLPEIALWKVHNPPVVRTMEKQVKCRIGYGDSSKLPQVKCGKYGGKPLVAAPEVKYRYLEALPVVNHNLPQVNIQNTPDAAPEVKSGSLSNASKIQGSLRLGPRLITTN